MTAATKIGRAHGKVPHGAGGKPGWKKVYSDHLFVCPAPSCGAVRVLLRVVNSALAKKTMKRPEASEIEK